MIAAIKSQISAITEKSRISLNDLEKKPANIDKWSRKDTSDFEKIREYPYTISKKSWILGNDLENREFRQTITE